MADIIGYRRASHLLRYQSTHFDCLGILSDKKKTKPGAWWDLIHLKLQNCSPFWPISPNSNQVAHPVWGVIVIVCKDVAVNSYKPVPMYLQTLSNWHWVMQLFLADPMGHGGDLWHTHTCLYAQLVHVTTLCLRRPSFEAFSYSISFPMCFWWLCRLHWKYNRK